MNTRGNARRGNKLGRRRARGLPTRVIIGFVMLGLLAGPIALLRPATSGAQGGWSWYKVDTHVHSAVSADAYVDVGIHAQLAKAQGYDALFLTDHNGGSSFHVNNLTANHMKFEDSYARWEQATFGSLSSSTNALVSSPVNTGSKSLRLKASATNNKYGETFVWTKRGPNFRSGDIILGVSIYPTQIDSGSGVYVSVSIGGDTTVASTPYGYTTQDGVISPGKSVVLVWQLGSVRANSSDPNARVIVNSLGSYTLNTWNHYTIYVSQALAAVPAADRPLDYNGLTHLKIAAAGKNGTADAYFDTYSITASAPVDPADEYVYRTSIADDFNTDTFKIFPSYEMGQQQHTNRFNFGITDRSQYVSYTYGADGIVDTQDSGYPAQLNHPGTTITTQDAIDAQGKGADFLEVRDQSWADAWDEILKQGVQMIGTWSSDTHTGLDNGKAATYIYASALEFDALMQSCFEGRVYNARNNFGGRLIFNLETTSLEPYPARYPVFVPSSASSVSVHLAVPSGLGSSFRIRWIVNDVEVALESPSGSSYEATKSISLQHPFTYVRAEVVTTSGSVRAMTQPIFFISSPDLPVDKRFHVDRVVTPDGRWYNQRYTKGITSGSWSTVDDSISFALVNPAGSLVTLNVVTASSPQRVRIDGTLIPTADSKATFDAATSSIWYYDADAKKLYVKAQHVGTSADVRIAFSEVGDTEPPTAPANLSAVAINGSRIDLSWDASTDNIGVTGYDIYRDGSLLTSIGTDTVFSDTTVGPATTYSYVVQARDGGGNISASSNTATATTMAASLFSDGFETGDLSQWTSVTGLVIEQADVFSGSYAARGTSTGSATVAYKQLATGQSELYYRLRFKLVSQGSNTVYLLRFRTGSNSSILGLYISNTGRLGYRNDVAGASTTSSTAVTLGAWHEIQIRVKISGTASETEVWYDGTRVDALTKTVDLGTNQVGRIQLGENATGRTYDIIFDDIVVSTGFIN
jgi:chitodextrinase